jgi:hypothetical protein
MFMVSIEYIFPLLHVGRNNCVYMVLYLEQRTSSMTLTMMRVLISLGHLIWKISFFLFQHDVSSRL